MPADFAHQGQLGATLFIDLARELQRRKLSGSLTLTRGLEKKVIQFTEGEVCGTASNQPQDSILSVLVRNNHLTREQADEIREQIAAGQKLGQALLDSSLVSRETLAGSQFEQITCIFSSLCEWTDGEYSFEAGAKAEAVSRLSVPDLLLNGARRIQDPERLRQLRGNEETRIQLAPGAMERCAEFRLQPQEGYLLTRLDAPITMDQLLMISGLKEDDTLRSLQALELAELIIVSGRPAPVRAASAPAAAPRSQSAAASATAAQTGAPPESNPKQPVSDEATMEEIMQMARLVAESNDDHAILGLTPSASRADVKTAYTRMAKKFHPDRYQKNSDEGTLLALKEIFAQIRKAYEKVRDLEPVITQPAPVATKPEPEPEPQPEPSEPVVEHYDHGAATPTWKVNPVVFETSSTDTAQPFEPPSPSAPFEPEASAAPAAEFIGASFDEAASQEAPEFAPAADDFQKAEPFDEEAVTCDTGELNQQTANLNFQHAIARYQSGDLPGAIELMMNAVQMAPDNAFFHDQLATMLAINPRRRKEAENHLLRAIELEPQNPEWLIHLGLLYKTIGFSARAEAQFKKALSLDSNNQTARKELRALRSAASAEADEKDAAKKSDAAKAGDLSVGTLLNKARDTSVSDLFSKFFKRK
jgi:tetratricopeptide (TPR) repeat protein